MSPDNVVGRVRHNNGPSFEGASCPGDSPPQRLQHAGHKNVVRGSCKQLDDLGVIQGHVLFDRLLDRYLSLEIAGDV